MSEKDFDDVYDGGDPIVDLSQMHVADKVRRHVSASYMQCQLEAIQAHAKGLGYAFVKDKYSTYKNSPPFIDKKMMFDFATLAAMARYECDYPNVEESKRDEWIIRSIEDGHANAWTVAILEALTALGISIKKVAKYADQGKTSVSDSDSDVDASLANEKEIV